MMDTIIEIMTAVFELQEGVVNATTTQGSVANWDSLRHINLVLALEDTFQIQFDEHEIPRLLSVAQIVDILSQKKG